MFRTSVVSPSTWTKPRVIAQPVCHTSPAAQFRSPQPIWATLTLSTTFECSGSTRVSSYPRCCWTHRVPGEATSAAGAPSTATVVEGSLSRRGSGIFSAAGTAVGWPGAGIQGGSSGGGRMAPDPVKVSVALSALAPLDDPPLLQAAVRLTPIRTATTSCSRITPPKQCRRRSGSGRPYP